MRQHDWPKCGACASDVDLAERAGAFQTPDEAEANSEGRRRSKLRRRNNATENFKKTYGGAYANSMTTKTSCKEMTAI